MSTIKTEADTLHYPKMISGLLREQYGLPRAADYIRAIRQESIRRRDGLFVGGMARTADVYRWIKENPNFRRRDLKASPNVL